MDFPIWMFEKKRLYFLSDRFDKDKYDYAFKNYKEKSDFQHLLILYLTFFYDLYPNKIEISYFEELLKNNSSEKINFPIKFEIDNGRGTDSLFDTEITGEEYYEKYQYNIIFPVKLKELTISDISLGCLNSISSKIFLKKEEYFKFNNEIVNNELLNYYYNISFDEKMIDNLLKTPEKLFKIIMLTKKIIDYDEYNTGLPNSKNDEFFKIILNKVNNKIENFKEKEIPKAIKFKKYKTYKMIKGKQTEIEVDYSYFKSLQILLELINDKELLKLISINEHKNYKKYNETYDYMNMISFIFLFEYERIFKLLGKEKIFETLDYYTFKNHYTWGVKYHFIELLFKYAIEKTDKKYIKSDVIPILTTKVTIEKNHENIIVETLQCNVSTKEK